MAGNGYNVNRDGGKADSDGFREKGKVDVKKPSYQDTYNPDANVKKLPQIKGAE